MTTKEAIERVRSRFDKWALDNEDLTALQVLGLVTAESEDERIRKEMIDYFSQYKDEGIRGVDITPWIAYLEKQKPADLSEMMVHKEPYIAPVPTPMVADEQKHILKFKVGDKVHLEGDDVNILTITGIEKDRYLTDCAYGPILFGAEDNWERIEQKPVKRIDFYDELYKRYTGPRDILAYVNMFVKKLGYVPIDIDELSACVYYVIKHKEEDTKAKESKQKTAEWGEEERKILDSIIDDYEKASKSFCGYDGKILVLKAIRDGEYNLPKQEWSEEDKKIIDTIVSVLGQYIDYKAVSGTGSGYATPRYSKEIDWLNSLSLNLKKKKEI